jgi:hypothetical protein
MIDIQVKDNLWVIVSYVTDEICYLPETKTKQIETNNDRVYLVINKKRLNRLKVKKSYDIILAIRLF